MVEMLIWLGIVCFVFGVVYPLAALIVYPFYKLLGGEMRLWEYMRSL